MFTTLLDAEGNLMATPQIEGSAKTMLAELWKWTEALQSLRAPAESLS
jgi:hypothetical protein